MQCMIMAFRILSFSGFAELAIHCVGHTSLGRSGKEPSPCLGYLMVVLFIRTVIIMLSSLEYQQDCIYTSYILVVWLHPKPLL